MDEQLMAWATSRPEVIAQPSNSTPFLQTSKSGNKKHQM